ncbi:unnamed protein product, partial [marine sediment metagenome]
MVFDMFTRGPYEGHTVTFVETYRGYDIYYLTGPGGLYGVVDPDGVEYNRYPTTLAKAQAYVDGVLGPPTDPEPEPDPEPEQAWEYHSTYRGIDIQVFNPGATAYTAYFDGQWHSAAKLATVQAGIDAYIGPEPEPDPEPDPTAKTLIGPYRGIDIYKFD